MTHTKGPWHIGTVDGFNACHVYSREDAIAAVYGLPLNTRLEAIDADRCSEALANARLIAAAPEALEALKQAEFAVEELCQGRDSENECWNILRVIRAAIAKATA